MKNGDKQIALTAKLEGAVMITDDKNFLNGLKLINQPVLSFEDFKKFLN
jgi:predicted nuclease of predicted toxin-antitoxin system